MEQYLLQILESNNRVIIPEFGAFIIKQHDPLIIVFNEFLQYNDGLLLDIIAKKEKLDKLKAKDKLDELVKVINETLNKGDKYPLGQLGTLTKSSTGRISLEESGSADTSKSIKEKTTSKVKSENEIKIDITQPIEIEKEQLKQKEEVKAEPKQVLDTTAIKPEKISHKETAHIKSHSLQTETDHKNLSTTRQKREESLISRNEDATTKRKKINLIVWIIVVLVVNGIIIAYFLATENLGNILLKETSKKDVIKIEKPATAKNITPVKKPDLTSEQVMAAIEDSVKKTIQEKTPTQVNAIPEKRYYIVAGVFSNEQNAKRMMKDLKLKGFNAENFGRIGNMYAVSYNYAVTKEEADRLLAKIKTEYDPKAWIKVRE